MATLSLTWKDLNLNEDGFNIYRSETPMDVGNMPSPIATLPANTGSYDDTTGVDGTRYYYRIGVFRGIEEKIGADFSVVFSDTFDIFEDGSAIAEYRFDGNLGDSGVSHNATWGEGSESYDVGVIGEGIFITGNSHVVLPDSINPFIEYSSRFSVSFWTSSGEISFHLMNKNGNTGFGIMMVRSSGGSDIGIIATSATDDGTSSIRNSGVYPRRSFFGTAIPPNSHIVFSKVGDTSYNFYLNGVFNRTVDVTTITATVNYPINWVGSMPTTLASNYPIDDTVFDQFRIFNRTLTQQDVDILYQEGL